MSEHPVFDLAGRDPHQLAADVEAWVRSRVDRMGTPESRTEATVKGRAALSELVALVSTLQQERDDLYEANWPWEWVIAGREKKRREAAEAENQRLTEGLRALLAGRKDTPA